MRVCSEVHWGSKFKNFTSIHERPIFWSLATNLGTTFKAPKNLGAIGEDSQLCPSNFNIPFGPGLILHHTFSYAPNGYSVLTCIWKCIKQRCNQHQLSLLSTMAGNTSSKFNNPYAYWCPDCDYKTNERVNLDIHLELNHKTTPSSTNEELIEAIEVWKIYKLIQRMKTKEVSTGFW